MAPLKVERISSSSNPAQNSQYIRANKKKNEFSQRHTRIDGTRTRRRGDEGITFFYCGL
jgi:hypothetical protein